MHTIRTLDIGRHKQFAMDTYIDRLYCTETFTRIYVAKNKQTTAQYRYLYSNRYNVLYIKQNCNRIQYRYRSLQEGTPDF